MKKILLCTDGSAFAQIGYEYVAWLARRIPIEIEVLYVTDRREEQAVQTHDFSGNLGIDTHQELLAKLVELEHERAKVNHLRAKIILEAAKDFFLQHDIAPETITLTHETGFLVDKFHELEKEADLIVLGKRGETAKFAAEHLGANLERIARSSHKPCLVTSRDFHQIEKVLFAYDGSESGGKALKFITETAVFSGLELHIVTVAKRYEDRVAIACLEKAEASLINGGFKPICQLLKGDSDTEIVNYADKEEIDFLIMGAYGHSRIRHLVLGSTTAQVMRRSHLPVLFFR